MSLAAWPPVFAAHDANPYARAAGKLRGTQRDDLTHNPDADPFGAGQSHLILQNLLGGVETQVEFAQMV
ncbi:MAG: hypothetical protein WBE26_18705 [Phycisphaerae bacterium]